MDTLLKHSTTLALTLIGLLLLSSSDAQAKITKLLKKRKIVVINDKRVKKGDQVCFYKKKTKRACGRVVKVSKSKKKSYVRVKKRSRFRKLEKGMMHEVVGAGGVARRSGGSSLFKLRLSYQPSINRRAKYTLPLLDESSAIAKFTAAAKPPNEGSVGRKLYNLAAAQAWLGQGLEFDALVYKNISIAVGSRYVWLAHSSSSAAPGTKLDTRDEAATGIKVAEHEISAWLDVYPYEIPTAAIRLGLGVEGNYNIALLSSDIVDCTKENGKSPCDNNAVSPPSLKSDIYKATASFIAMSFRLTARRNFQITDNFGVGTALRGIISPPQIQFNKATKLDGNPKEVIALFGDAKKMETELDKVLDYKPAWYSVMLELSAFLAF